MKHERWSNDPWTVYLGDKKLPGERAQEVAKMLLQESDRGCVIFGAAILEDDLEGLLRAYCRKDEASVKRVVDPLFESYAPFSTFSAKIQVSYALGLIRHELKQTLDLVRRLRNDVAHEKGPVSFQLPEYQSRLSGIIGCEEDGDAADDDNARIPQISNTTKRQLVDRVAFCLRIADTSARIWVVMELLNTSENRFLSAKTEP